MHAAEGDVADFDSCAAMFYNIASVVGPVDILVNNAGITRDSVFKRMTEADWMAVINTNLNSVFNVTRQVIDGMSERGWGRIINISSVNAIKGQFGQTNYSAAKAGVLGLAKAMAREFGADGIRVNCVTPGLIGTDITAGKLTDEMRAKILEGIPLGRLGEASDVAGIYTFLASDLSAYVTGAVIDVNGGMLIH